MEFIKIKKTSIDSPKGHVVDAPLDLNFGVNTNKEKIKAIDGVIGHPQFSSAGQGHYTFYFTKEDEICELYALEDLRKLKLSPMLSRVFLCNRTAKNRYQMRKNTASENPTPVDLFPIVRLYQLVKLQRTNSLHKCTSLRISFPFCFLPNWVVNSQAEFVFRFSLYVA